MMISGRMPFREHDDNATLFKILDVNYDLPGDVNSDCKSLIKSMLVR